MATAAPALEQNITCDPALFRANFNSRPFEVEHALAGHPLFSVSRLIELAQKTRDRVNPHRPFGDAYCLIGDPKPGEKTLESNVPVTTVAETMSQIENASAWIMLNHIEREEEYREILETYICDLMELSGRELITKIKWFEAIAFITSPRRVTNYHVDRECSWLLQIQGDKEIHLFDKADKEVVPETELEHYWAVNNVGTVYKPQYESRAMVFHMKPGTGVHIPVNCPHWLRNGNNVSVSLNVNFVFRDEIWGNIYKANYHLRKRGLRPNPPGSNATADALKSFGYTTMQKLNRLRKGSKEIPDESREQYQRVAARMAERAQHQG